MATSRHLITNMADLLGFSPASVETSYRELRENGLVAKAGRGPHASAKMAPRDAAALFTALLGSVRLGDAAGTIKMFSATRDDKSQVNQIPLPEVAALKSDHSFLDLVEALFAAGASGNLQKLITKDYGAGLVMQEAHRVDVVVQKPHPVARVRIHADNTGWELIYSIPWTDGEKDLRKLEQHIKKLSKELGIKNTGYRETLEKISAMPFIKIGTLLSGAAK